MSNITFNPFASSTMQNTFKSATSQPTLSTSSNYIPSFSLGVSQQTTTTPSTGFTFGNPISTQPTLNNSNTSIFNRATQPLGASNTINTSISNATVDNTQNIIENQLTKIKKIVEQLANTTDKDKIDELKFHLNCKITYLSKNINRSKNYFLTIYHLSKYLKTIDANLLDNIFFLDIQTNLQDFAKSETQDWLANNLFDVAFAIKKTLLKFMATDVTCTINNDCRDKNKVALKFFAKDIIDLQYVLGDFLTKKNFLASINFDIECLRVKQLWEQQNQNYVCTIASNYDQYQPNNSYLYISVRKKSTDSNEISVGVKAEIENLFNICDKNILYANKTNWFNFLDRITAANYAVECYNFDSIIKISTIDRYKYDENSDKNNFYNALAFSLQKIN